MKLKHILTRDAVTHLSGRCSRTSSSRRARSGWSCGRSRGSRASIPWSNIVYGTLVDEDEG
jgi:hypothetical protein